MNNSQEAPASSAAGQRFWASTDMEFFSCGPLPTREEAVRYAVSEYGLTPADGPIYTGIERPISLEEIMPDAESLLENMHEQLYEKIGEAADSFDCSREDIADLQGRIEDTIKTWATERGIKITCFAIENVEKHEVPA